MIVVADASPLNYLIQIKCDELLEKAETTFRASAALTEGFLAYCKTLGK